MSFVFGYQALITLAIGIFTCFFGYKCKKIVFSLIWFIIGFTIATNLLPYVMADTQMVTLISAIVGLIFALFGYNLEMISIFVTIGYMAGSFIFGYLPFAQIPNIIIAVIVGALAGSLAVRFAKPLFIVTTSFKGADLILASLQTLIIGIPSMIIPIVEIVLIVLGIVFQFYNCKNVE